MKKIFLLFNAALLTVAVFASPSYAFDKTGCEMNCQKCHTITNDEIKDILKKLKAPDAEIVKVDLSPMKSLWEVSINNKGKMGLFYVDFSKQYVVSGSIIEVKTGKNKTAEEATRLRDSRRVDFSKIPLNQGLVVGDASASRKVAVFTDPD